MVKKYQDAISKLWNGCCDVFVRETVRNTGNGRDEPTEVQKIRNEPCRLSFSSISSTTEKDDAALIQQTVKLFIAMEADIPPGAKIVVTQNGVTRTFTRSGEPAFYSTHQEIILVPFERWA